MPVYDETYIKAKVREFDGVIKTNFLVDEVPKSAIACVTIDFVMRMEKKSYLRVYLEECKYKVKKIQMPRFINTELESDSESGLESDSESNSDAELMTKLKSGSDSE